MRRAIYIVLILLTLAVCSCTSRTPTATLVSGRITFAGSTTVQPLAHRIGEEFRKHYPAVELDITAGGTRVGIQAVHNGMVDIGMASRALTPEESADVKVYQIAVDVIAVVVHPDNPVNGLSLAQLAAIYRGEITDWNQVGGPDLPILVVVREPTSGTRGAFDEIVLDKQDPTAPNQRGAVTASEVVALVSENSDAIGYVGFGHLEPGVIKVLSIDDVLPTEQTAYDGSYPLVRPLLLLTGPLTQPIAYKYIEFALSSEGQRIVKESGWVPAIEQK